MLVKGRVARSEDRLSLHAQPVVVPDLTSRRRQGPGAGEHRGRPAAPRRWSTGCGTSCRRIPGPPPCTSAAQRRRGHHAQAGRRAAGDPDVGADGRSEGAARRGLPGVNRFTGLSRAHGAGRGGCVLLGVLQGVLWAFLAPGVPYKVLADGRYGALPTTSTYYFVGVAVFALSGVAIGVVLAVGAWQVRAARGAGRWSLTLVGGSLRRRVDRLVARRAARARRRSRPRWGPPPPTRSSRRRRRTGTLLVVLRPTGHRRRGLHLPGRLERTHPDLTGAAGTPRTDP